eukprot:TRINITY_DN5686_c0_g1_i1.p1 TRINITY_DN5686_c0_g1~~TRINITY_DN5686_c0_g1_i1.p1  ORF type:complete len:150 (+),score=21.47 TRINITY_DN5686_c0_g1_i1:212-661(+)
MKLTPPFQSSDPFLSELVELAATSYRETNGRLPEPILYALYSFFGSETRNALEFLDSKAVTEISCSEESQEPPIKIISVKEHRQSFFIFDRYPFRCPCSEWERIPPVDAVGIFPRCAHSIALILGKAFGLIRQKSVSKEVFIDTVANMD